MLEVGDEINNSQTEEEEGKAFHHKDCTVCLEPFKASDVAAKLDCGHKFHENCLVDWLEKKSNCPICRAQVH
jgi:hypothetical protein